MTFSFRSPASRLVLSSTLIASTLVGPAFGQQAVPASASASPSVVVPPMNCPKPSDFMPNFKTTQELNRFNKSLDVYKSCVNDYVKANSTKATELAAQANAYNDAANDQIKGFNAYMVELNEASKAAGDKSPTTNQGSAPKINP